jgi:hypothetical protein
MKKLRIFSIIILAFVLVGCNMPGSQEGTPVDQDDSMATEIARILTGTPVEVETSPTPQVEEGEPTEVVETEVEETEEPTATPEPEEETEEPTEEATDTQTPEVTEEEPVEETPTLAESDPARTLGEPDWIDNMENGDNWATGYSDYTDIDFEDGYLKMVAETELDGWRLAWPYLGDFYLEAKMKSTACEGSDHFGLMFRVPAGSNANKGYLFGITCDGKYGLRRWDGQMMYSLISWGEHAAVINEGEDVFNTLGVMAEGDALTLYINGEEVAEVTGIDSYLEGSFGIFIGGMNAEEPEVWVDYVRYWIIE